MIRGYEAQAVREAEAPLLEAGEPLMHRAARALADHVAAHLRDTAGERAGDAAGVLVLAGAGANGGDGLHAAALLRREGIAADAIATADRLHEEGAAAPRAAPPPRSPPPPPACSRSDSRPRRSCSTRSSASAAAPRCRRPSRRCWPWCAAAASR